MGIVRAHKTTENTALFMSRNAYAIITHTKQCSMSLLIFTHRDLYIASFGTVLDCITDEIAHYLLNTVRVDSCNNVLWCIIHRDSMSLSCHLEPLYCTMNERTYVGRLEIQFEAPSLQACHIKQIFGKFDQSACCLVNILNGLHLPIGEFWSLATHRLYHQHLRKAFHHG